MIATIGGHSMAAGFSPRLHLLENYLLKITCSDTPGDVGA